MGRYVASIEAEAWENGLTGGAECGGEIGAMDGSPTGRCIDGAEG